MATVRQNAAHPLESQFPIVATNLRALVSSWLPLAREPSPEYDDDALDENAEGRPERYLHDEKRRIDFHRLALGATPATIQADPDFQKRMNKKMGILPVNGTAKREGKKYSVNGLVNGSRKRKVQQESSDSEEDSKSKLVMKSMSKKVILSTETTPKKKKSSEVRVHKTISQTTTTFVVSTSPTESKLETLTTPISKPLPLSPKTTTLKPLEVSSTDRNAEPNGSQQSLTTNGSQQMSETAGQRTDANRRKKEKKREKDKLKKRKKKHSKRV